MYIGSKNFLPKPHKANAYMKIIFFNGDQSDITRKKHWMAERKDRVEKR